MAEYAVATSAIICYSYLWRESSGTLGQVEGDVVLCRS